MNRFADFNLTLGSLTPGQSRACVSCDSSQVSAEELPDEVVKRLEELDDSVFAALEGDAEALDRSVQLWRAVTSEFEPEVVAETREQYLRRAETVWHESRNDPVDSLPKAFAAIEVMNLLAD